MQMKFAKLHLSDWNSTAFDCIPLSQCISNQSTVHLHVAINSHNTHNVSRMHRRTSEAVYDKPAYSQMGRHTHAQPHREHTLNSTNWLSSVRTAIMVCFFFLLCRVLIVSSLVVPLCSPHRLFSCVFAALGGSQ